ncbi:antigenic cell wall galactomannoprotein-like protein [Dactylonectria macrodidyma]|uniref:Antigenic cell wall galactomannoprotein-like protein n=1 Tax=Dactylonectria macrodidyma TaxID=307937 RepID=A0A9P9EBI3_9HYPO|nr:antigenic cell wall galactomannoprotein-like protein [Dactylonectria macrodidyma]
MLFPKVLALVSLASTALASGASIVAAISTISATTTDLDDAVTSWSGGVLGTIPIVIKSTALLIDINNGTKTAEASAALSIAEALQVAQATIKLSDVVVDALDNIVAAKPKFDKLLLSPVIWVNLQLQQKATKEFSAAVVEKVPAALQAVAETLVAGINTAFEEAIEAYAL